jgi:membrane-bound ClpP family serine protease
MIMKNLKTVFILTLVSTVLFAGVCLADTFTNRQTNETLHGYITARLPGSPQNVRRDESTKKAEEADDAPISVYTQEKGLLKLNLKEWEIKRDNLGRNNKVIIVPVDDDIMYEIETDAFEKAIADSSQEGPLFILVEIDTPGGRVDLAQRMCNAITRGADCNVIAFVKGGKNGGAISAGAAVALSCNKIYMTDNTIIGAATLINMPKEVNEFKDKKYEDVINEKYSSAWRAYLASLAQQNDRPGPLARAMVDSSIEVVEVNQGSKRLFIDPVNKRAGQQVTRTWNKSGTLLSLTAREAVESTIADGLVGSREQLLQQLQAGDANVVTDKKVATARKDLQIAQRKKEEAMKDLDMKYKQSKYPQPMPKFMGILRGAKSDVETIKTLAQKYPDLHIDVESAENELNSINAAYENALRESRSRRK